MHQRTPYIEGELHRHFYQRTVQLIQFPACVFFLSYVCLAFVFFYLTFLASGQLQRVSIQLVSFQIGVCICSVFSYTCAHVIQVNMFYLSQNYIQCSEGREYKCVRRCVDSWLADSQVHGVQQFISIRAGHSPQLSRQRDNVLRPKMLLVCRYILFVVAAPIRHYSKMRILWGSLHIKEVLTRCRAVVVTTHKKSSPAHLWSNIQ